MAGQTSLMKLQEQVLQRSEQAASAASAAIDRLRGSNKNVLGELLAGWQQDSKAAWNLGLNFFQLLGAASRQVPVSMVVFAVPSSSARAVCQSCLLSSSRAGNFCWLHD